MKLNIIFDIGNVLIKWDPNTVYANYFAGDLQKIQNFFQETDIFKWNELIDAGTPVNNVIQKMIDKFPHYHEPISLWHTKWLEMISGAIEGSVAILKNLYAQKVPLYALSNWSAETFMEHIRHQYSFFDYFKDIVLSGVEKVIKPDIKIYQILLERNQLQAHNCLFIDDNPNNLPPAQKLGMDVIKFESPEQLRQELTNRKVILI